MTAAACFERTTPFDPILFGEVVARSAASPRERVAEDAMRLLGVDRSAAVLELGCGTGWLLSQVAARVAAGVAIGIDPSEGMVRHARLRNRHWITSGRADVIAGWSHDLSSFAEGRFDRVFGVHVVYFWSDPPQHLAQMRRVLRPGGCVVLGFWPEHGAAPGSRAPRRARIATPRVAGWLAEAGFEDVRSEESALRGGPLAWVTARGGPER